MKRVIAGLVLTVLFLGTLSTVAAGGGPSRAPDLEKVTFVHYEKSNGDGGPPTWDDTEDDYRLIMGGVKWEETVTYEVNNDGSELTEADVTDALDASADTWDSETAFDLFAGVGTTDSTSIGHDWTNRIVWSDLDEGVIAVNTLWIDPANKEIVESDVQFNTYYTWSDSGESGKMDLQNIATHEFGHNGLDDLRPPKDGDLTMYYASSSGEIKKRTLGTGDKLGIQDLYGE